MNPTKQHIDSANIGVDAARIMISISHTIAIRALALVDGFNESMRLPLPRCRQCACAIEIIAAFAAVTFALPRTAEAITVEVTDRDDNEWDLGSSDLEEANLKDCLDGVGITFTVNLDSESTSGRELYLYEGSSCDDSPGDCRIVGDAQSASDLTFDIAVDDLFEDGCNSSDTATVWAALLESENQEVDDDGFWSSSSLSITLDVEGPSTVPAGLSTRVGSGNVRVSWDEVDDDDVAGFLIVYWTDDSTSNTGSDAGSDPEGECSVSGGFTEGGDYDPSLITDYEDSQKDYAAATSATVSGLENGVQYEFAVVSLNDAANPSVFSEVVCATPEETVDFGDIYSDAGGRGGGEYCFIATAAFGSYNHPVVRVLRRFRDEFLGKLPGGKSAIAGYYAVGPTLAAVIEGHEVVRQAVAGCLLVFSGIATCLMSLGPLGFGVGLAACVFVGLVIGLALPRRRKSVSAAMEAASARSLR